MKVDAEESESRFELRASTGLGIGYIDNYALAARLGIAGTYWLTERLGVGAEVGVFAQATALDSSSAVVTVLPELAYRYFVSPKDHLLLVGSLGYAWNRVSLYVPCRECWFGSHEPVSSHGLGSSLQIGIIHDPGPVFFGFALRGDFVGFPENNRAPMHGGATVNGIFGF